MVSIIIPIYNVELYLHDCLESLNRQTIKDFEVIFVDDADIIQKQSTKGNFISITVKQVVMNVDEIIAIYEKAAEIEGVMSL